MRKRLTVFVVLGVVVAGFGMLVPAVLKVRQAAQRMLCQNHLLRLSMTLHGYHDTHGSLPAGTLPNPSLPPEERLSFHADLFPFTETPQLSGRIFRMQAWNAPPNAEIATVPIELMCCPSFPNRHSQGL